MDDAVSLCALKRFVADYEVGKREIPVPVVRVRKEGRVAVVGGGPSGMTCALYSRKAGYRVTIFESRDALGGMLSFGVPPFRLPPQVVEREVSLIEKAGIEVRYNTKIGRDVSLKEVRDTFDAVYIGCGAQAGARLGLENEDAPGVLSGIGFLGRAGEERKVGKRVIVVGGGNVAVDAALTARMSGAQSVRIVCLERREEMAAGEHEVDRAGGAGVGLLAGWAPQTILTGEGRVKGVQLVRCASVFDGHGNFSPAYERKITKTIRGDTVIVAIGQAPETGFVGELPGLELTEGGWIRSDPATPATTLPGVFAGGDVVAGPGMAVAAIADGKRAAARIDDYLSGEPSRPANARTGGKRKGR